MNKRYVAPSILSGNFASMGSVVSNVEAWGADMAHCDVMDGVFVPNITFGMPMISAIRPYTQLPLDVHLMIIKPEKYVERFCDAGADYVTFHPEASDHPREALLKIKAKGKKCGLVVNPDKDLSLVADYMDILDMIVLMGVYPGYGGQKYIPETTEKIKLARKLIDDSGRKILLELDGGVTVDNAEEVRNAGLDVIVCGNATFSADNPAEAVKRIRG